MPGSKWRKWDLHFHTQTSYDHQSKTTTDQEIVDKLVSCGVEVIAITDHNTIDVARIRNLQKLGKGRLTVLPGIEFLSDSRADDPIHFIAIFDEDCKLDYIWGELKHNTSLKKIEGEGKKHNEVYCELPSTIEKIKELGGIVTIHAGSKSNSFERITHAIPHGMAQKEDIARLVDIFELGKEKDFEAYAQMVLPHVLSTTGKSMPTIICSDNHDVNSYSVKQNLWIKAEPTFEGLKQILYEPSYRVYVGQEPPINPLRSIDKVVFDFPENCEFEGEPFCFSGRLELDFSPNFTCIIGGRGTGKSTLLNLIHEKLKPSENIFFRSKKIKGADGKVIDISECVKIDNDDDDKQIEFLSQNEIEEFAQNYSKLTNAIYSRLLKSDIDGSIETLEEALKNDLLKYRLNTIVITRLNSLNKDVLQKRKEKASYQKIVDSFSSPEYKELSQAVQNATKVYGDFLKGKETFIKLGTDLSELIKALGSRPTENYFDQETARIVSEIKSSLTKSSEGEIIKAEEQLTALENTIAVKQAELRQFLSDKGVTSENLNDISNAAIIISGLEGEIAEKEKEITSLEENLKNFDKEKLKKSSIEYKEKLEIKIRTISEILENIDNKSVKPISLHLDFDMEAARQAIFDNFKSLFEGRINQSAHKGDGILKELLFTINPEDIIDRDTMLVALKSHSSSSAAKLFLIDLFAEASNFEAYKWLCERNLLDYASFRKINVFYDGRPVDSSSFGQRCTAVLVILLLLGNNPIIIDEPEAHLDSLLIANYLVDVLKKSKQSRQIIFATHNANFVINGDAEYIHILANDETTGKTQIHSTTIENPKTKETLVSLEGGKDAFYKRETKYQFKK
ncbi:TrlF family AAA-like ATPase [Pedobacter frigoris]|uniref:PHP domain-containing protein n=1 Tax=Pedobacter frigoris TaxID=2571272 RepID=A0A4U1CI72_9SPHI|nr:PHP domain-containing protein [Pedobacter frigoris]TKC04347.1 PHP domain-containing protein [Pedobacter frigoris]